MSSEARLIERVTGYSEVMPAANFRVNLSERSPLRSPADRRSVGIALLVFVIIPLGDMSIVLGSGESKSKAFSKFMPLPAR
jgi:hypothetical protein